MKKILINENSIAVSYAIDAAKDAAKAINEKLIPALKTIGIPASDEVLKDLFSGTNKTEKSYLETVEADLEKINNPAIREGMRFTAAGAWGTFENALMPMMKDVKHNFQHITIVEGKAVLSPESIEAIKEQHRIYITSPEQIEAYKLHVEIVEKLNQLFKNGTPFLWVNLFPEDTTGKIIRNDESDYSQFTI